MSEHGTITRYVRGCRCDECRGANNAYKRKHGQTTRARARSGHLAPDAPQHGTVGGYTNHACRCEPCRTAYATYRRDAGTNVTAMPNLALIADVDFTGAACASHSADLWFPPPNDSSTAAAAIRVCKTCPIEAKCLDYALKAGERYGVWGATTQNQRRRMLRQGRGA